MIQFHKLFSFLLIAFLTLTAAQAQKFSEQDIIRFHNAAVQGDIATMTSYLDKGMDVNQTRGTMESTPLIAATKFGQVESVRFLLSRGADPKLQDFMERNALFYAKREKHSEIVKLLKKGSK